MSQQTLGRGSGSALKSFDNKLISKLKEIGSTWGVQDCSLLWGFGREMWEDYSK